MRRFMLMSTVIACGLSSPTAANDGKYALCYEKGVAADWGLCIDLTPEIAAAHRRGDKVENFGSCIPEGTTDDQVRSTLKKWLAGRPAYNRYSAYSTISGGLSVIYRCK
ncbi:MAG: hypothetical protein A3G18_12205 [Rhodospirillales bacterium RIFCSPLOWO2_12_FULL_58_28]|nr:MAG: hypothetical protein A3H92_12220 [Rhodospirillales bacterium RIFCSPLOWO2_02_FULL_58_16]OHC79627.1 MAG: hypothetical protein A3G18_12205 [Rhodospirillales bacterium RIFCSPLOWO2_12_FULL_58_28]